MTQQLPGLIGRLPGANLDPDQLNTQEQAWALAAAGALSGNSAKTEIAFNGAHLTASGRVSVALHASATASNLGSQPVWQTVSITGIPAAPPAPASKGLTVSRRFLTLEGKTLDPATLKQNEVFVMLISGSETDGEDHHALLVAGLPAGWEIAGRFQSGTPEAMKWLGELSATGAQFAADDRFAAAIDLGPDQKNFRIAVMLRAVTPGSYALPGLSLADMYRPLVFAGGAAGSVTVAPP
ncbi:MAG: hypothetical protein ACREFJ_15920, partial [Acetobacteraceae bacterium]